MPLSSPMSPVTPPSAQGGEGVHQKLNLESPAHAALNKAGEVSVVNPVHFVSAESITGHKPATLASTMQDVLSVTFKK